MWKEHFQWVYGKRPREELYDLREDPSQTKNVAGLESMRRCARNSKLRLLDELKRTGDPRLIDDGRFFETPPMSGPVNDAEGAPRRKR